LHWQSRYRHARQAQRAKKELRRLKTYCGRVVRDVERKIAGNELQQEVFSELLTLGHRLLNRRRTITTNCTVCMLRRWSVSPRRRTHKKYEFGSKVSLVTTSRECFVVAKEIICGNAV